MSEEEMYEEYFGDDFNLEGSEDCPVAESLLSICLFPRPFGIDWSKDKVVNFLKKCGYKIITRFDDISGENFKVAIKEGSKDTYIPDEENLMEVFTEELQDILINWLLTIREKR